MELVGVDLFSAIFHSDVRLLLLVSKTFLLIYFQYSWKQIFAVGKPIHVNQNVNPSTEDIGQLHDQYTRAVEELFETNKDKYGLGHVKLEIVWFWNLTVCPQVITDRNNSVLHLFYFKITLSTFTFYQHSYKCKDRRNFLLLPVISMSNWR